MDIFKLVGSIFVDNESANESLSKTDKKASSVGETLGKVGKGAAAVGTAVIGATSALTGAVVGMASSSAESMDVIDKASQRMGIAAESYQELAHAASLSGVEMGTLEKAAKKLEGTDLNLDQALAEIYELGTAEERAEKAAELFGDNIAYTLTPMLNASGEQFAAMRQEANDLGLVFSGDAVQAGAALNDALSNVKDSAAALVTGLGNELAPIVMKFCEMILEYMPMIMAMLGQLAPIIEMAFDKLLPPIIELVDQLLPVILGLIGELLPPITDIISTILPILTQLLQMVMPFIVQIAQMILPVIVSLLQALSPILEPILKLLSPILELVVALLQPLLDLINLILPPIISLASAIAGALANTLGKAIEKIVEVVQNMRDKFKTVFEGLVGIIKAPINGIISFINGLISGVTGGINAVIRALNRIHVELPKWAQDLTGVTSIGFNIAELTPFQIPLLAKGGEVEGQAIVGEDGPELLSTKGRKTVVTPLNENNNAFVELNKKLDILIALLSDGFGVYLDSGAVVGQLAPDIDDVLGRMAVMNGRRVYAGSN